MSKNFLYLCNFAIDLIGNEDEKSCTHQFPSLNDFIFAVLSEELGFIGVLLLFILVMFSLEIYSRKEARYHQPGRGFKPIQKICSTTSLNESSIAPNMFHEFLIKHYDDHKVSSKN